MFERVETMRRSVRHVSKNKALVYDDVVVSHFNALEL